MHHIVKLTKFAVVAMSAASLAACSSSGGMFSSSRPSYQAEPREPAMRSAPSGMSASQIKSILSDKSWRWQGPNNSGVTLYASDGTSLVEVSGKGTTTGKWLVKDGQLCESFAPAPFLPGGVAMTCQPFSGSNNVYQVGAATFTLA